MVYSLLQCGFSDVTVTGTCFVVRLNSKVIFNFEAVLRVLIMSTKYQHFLSELCTCQSVALMMHNGFLYVKRQN